MGQYQKKHSPTHTHPDHQTSLINFLHLLRSTASSIPPCSIYVLHSPFPQPLSRSSLVYLLVWTLYFILHAFLHPIIFFSQHMPCHHNLFCCSTEIMSSIRNLPQLIYTASQLLIELQNLFRTLHFVAETSYSVISCIFYILLACLPHVGE